MFIASGLKGRTSDLYCGAWSAEAGFGESGPNISAIWAAFYSVGATMLGKQMKHASGPIGIAVGVVAVLVFVVGSVMMHRHERRLTAASPVQMRRRELPQVHRVRPHGRPSGSTGQGNRPRHYPLHPLEERSNGQDRHFWCVAILAVLAALATLHDGT